LALRGNRGYLGIYIFLKFQIALYSTKFDELQFVEEILQEICRLNQSGISIGFCGKELGGDKTIFL
jgi:hypothetical protein